MSNTLFFSIYQTTEKFMKLKFYVTLRSLVAFEVGGGGEVDLHPFKFLFIKRKEKIRGSIQLILIHAHTKTDSLCQFTFYIPFAFYNIINIPGREGTLVCLLN